MSSLWVFGYGSLCWNPGFEYSDAHVGYVKGYKRRFWQGNDAHRGTPEKLGRVVTLIEGEQEITWGKSFQMNDELASREYLDNRESTLGGYSTIITTFYPRDPSVAPFPVLVYMATEENAQYLGPAPLPQIAHEIATSQGNAGHNVEYLAKLALFMRVNIPDVYDHHLYTLEHLCKKIVEQLQPSLLYFFATPDVNSILGQLSDFTVPLNMTSNGRKNSLVKSNFAEKTAATVDLTQFTHLRREINWHRRLSRRMNVGNRPSPELIRRFAFLQLQSEKQMLANIDDDFQMSLLITKTTKNGRRSPNARAIAMLSSHQFSSEANENRSSPQQSLSLTIIKQPEDEEEEETNEQEEEEEKENFQQQALLDSESEQSGSDEDDEPPAMIVESTPTQQQKVIKQRSSLLLSLASSLPVQATACKVSSSFVRLLQANDESSDCPTPPRLARARSMDVNAVSAARAKPWLKRLNSSAASEGAKSPPPSPGGAHFTDFVNIRQLRCVKI